MKIITFSPLTITAIALMAKSCSAAVCITLNVNDFLNGVTVWWAVVPPEGTTDILCDVTCESYDNIGITLVLDGDEVSSTYTCGTTISHSTSEDVLIKVKAANNRNLVITCNCNNLSTSAPSSSTPSAAPVSGHAPTPSPASSCFSQEATVTVEQPGQSQAPVTTKMTELKIGDMILTANNRYQPIYAFAHNDATTDTTFLQIHTTSGKNKNKNPLEVTGQHLVYVQGKDAPVTAKSIKVGDSLTQAGHRQGGAAVVTKIETVQRHGIYAPLTHDGTLVVDGTASSCYVSLQPTGNPQTMELKGHSMSIFSHHRVAHILLTVPRLVCIGGINPNWCQTYNNDGVALFVQTAFDLSDWFHAQHWVVQLFLFAVYLVVLCPLYALELLFGTKLAAVMAVGGLVFVAVVRGNAPAVGPMDVKKEA